MISVKYERYWNAFNRTHETKSFETLHELEEWIFDQMEQVQQACRQQELRLSSAMFFPTPKSMEKIAADGPCHIMFKPNLYGQIIFVHEILTESGVIFSDGEFTAGQKHWTREVQDWLTHCFERQTSPKNNIVVELERPQSVTYTTYSPSAVSGRRISIDIGHGKTLDVEFFQLNLEGPLEVSLSITDKAGNYQDLAMLRPDENGKNMEVLLWKDPVSEDYTDRIEIPFGEYSSDFQR